MCHISHDLDDLLIPNALDLCIYDRIDDPDVLEHINRVGKLLFQGMVLWNPHDYSRACRISAYQIYCRAYYARALWE